MQLSLFLRLGVCLVVFSSCLFSYLNKQNDLTKLKIQIPKVQKELKVTLEEVQRLQYEIEQFENPARLMDFAAHPEFSHLKHPLVRDILMIEKGIALEEGLEKNQTVVSSPATVRFGSK